MILTYDSWGKLLSIEDTSKVNAGQKNPYRYRGYRYDTETGLYYLNSRYYNPEWGRFLNADTIVGDNGTILAHNMYLYCFNNPVNMADPNGYWPKWVRNLYNKAKNWVANTFSGSSGASASSSTDRNNGSNSNVSTEPNAPLRDAGHAMVADTALGYASGLIKETRVPVTEYIYPLVTLETSKSSLSKLGQFAKKAGPGYGTTIITAYSASTSIANGEYYGAALDIAGGFASYGIGIWIAKGVTWAVGAAALTGGMALVAGAVGVGLTFAAGWALNKTIAYIKKEYYQ